jgi:hypothetical protein
MWRELLMIPLRHAKGTAREICSELRQLGSGRKLRGVDRLQLGASFNALLVFWPNETP